MMKDELQHEPVEQLGNERPAVEKATADVGTEQTKAGSEDSTMLYRHPSNRLIGGVCGGLADYLGLDANLMRILWVILTLGTAGGGLLAYLALWVLLPVGTDGAGVQKSAVLALNERNIWRTGVALMGLGLLWLLANLGILPMLWGGLWSLLRLVFWPIVLIGAGFLLLRSQRDGADWGHNLRESVQGIKGRVNGRSLDGEHLKQGLKSAQQHIPIKRSHSDRLFLGVCGGLGRSLHLDANLIRLIWAAFSIGSLGMGVLVYVVVALLLPEEQVTVPARYQGKSQDVQVVDGSVNRSVKV